MSQDMPELPDLDAAVLEDNDDEAPTRTRKPRSDKGKPRGPRSGGGRTPSTKKIADDLLVPYATLCAGLSFTSPTAAGFLLQRGEKTVDAVVSMAAGNPRMLNALKKGAKVGPAMTLIETLFGAAVAFGMDMGRIPPTHPMGAMLGVSQVFAEVHKDDMPPAEAATPDFSPNGMPFPTQQWAMPS